jgi:hypothetical protein
VAATCLLAGAGAASAECRWIVQPHDTQEEDRLASTLVNIVFDGLELQRHFFYGFTVTDVGLAWDLTATGTLPDLGPHGRALSVVATESGPAFEVDAQSIEPHTVYLVAALSPVHALETMKAGIQPDQPFAVSARTRGATDVSGPLPTRSLPGVEIRASGATIDLNQWLALRDRDLAAEAGAHEQRQPADKATVMAANDIDPVTGSPGADDLRDDVQICAYQVAMR